MFAVITKKQLALFISVIVVIVVFSAGITLITVSAEKKLIPIYYTDRQDSVSISFDAAWGSDKTKRIVDCCLEYGIKTTFFLTGFWIDANPEMVKYINDAGFEIGNHSENHYNMSGLSKSKVDQEIESVNTKIYNLTGVMPTLFRPPFGDYNNTLIKSLNDKNMYCIQWNVDSLDWKGLSAKEIEDRVLSKIEGGSICLFHNNSDHIVEALPNIIEGIFTKGLKIVPIGELIHKNGFTIDSNGKQIKND